MAPHHASAGVSDEAEQEEGETWWGATTPVRGLPCGAGRAAAGTERTVAGARRGQAVECGHEGVVEAVANSRRHARHRQPV